MLFTYIILEISHINKSPSIIMGIFFLSLFTPTDSILPLTDATSLFSGETEFSSINRGDFSAIETHGWSVTAGCCGGKKMTWMNTGFKIVSTTLQHPRLKTVLQMRIKVCFMKCWKNVRLFCWCLFFLSRCSGKQKQNHLCNTF